MKYKITGINIINGYKIIKIENYPRSKSVCYDNWYYEHIVLCEEELGRSLNDDEVVHHLDGNPRNNRLNNLVVISSSAHNKIHAWMNRNSIMPVQEKVPECKICGITLQKHQDIFCSRECLNEDKSINKIDEKKLLELMKSDMSMLEIAKIYNVSDNAIRKWCKKYKIPCSLKDRKSYRLSLD